MIITCSIHPVLIVRDPAPFRTRRHYGPGAVRLSGRHASNGSGVLGGQLHE